jgi:hypothetical protein
LTVRFEKQNLNLNPSMAGAGLRLSELSAGGRRARPVLFLESGGINHRYRAQLQKRRAKARHYADSIALPLVRGGNSPQRSCRRVKSWVPMHRSREYFATQRGEGQLKNPLVRSPVWAGCPGILPAADANTVCSPMPTDSWPWWPWWLAGSDHHVVLRVAHHSNRLIWVKRSRRPARVVHHVQDATSIEPLITTSFGERPKPATVV